MNFRVVFQTPGERDLEEAYRWIAGHEPLAAERWRERFYLALKSLESDPERMPLAAENKFVTRELREFHFGKLRMCFACCSLSMVSWFALLGSFALSDAC